MARASTSDFFPGAGTQRGEDRAVATDGVYYPAKVKHIPLNHAQVRVLRQSFGAADKSSDCVSLGQRLRNNQLASTSSGAEDDDLHLSPVVPSQQVATTTLYMAQPFPKADI